MKYRYDKTKVLDEQIEAQDLTELRDAYEELVLLQEDYWQLKEIRNELPALHPLFTDASKRMCDARKAYTGALTLVDLMASERAMRAVCEAPEKERKIKCEHRWQRVGTGSVSSGPIQCQDCKRKESLHYRNGQWGFWHWGEWRPVELVGEAPEKEGEDG